MNVSSLRAEGKKLGLGSSAAAAAAAAGLVFARAGRDLDDAATRSEILELAFEGHRAVAPRGSGADVAASVLGGYLRFRRMGDRVEASPLAWPASLRIAVVWTGTEIRTSTMLDAVAALRESDPQRHMRCFDTLQAAASGAIHAVESGQGGAVLEAVRLYASAMDGLGRAAGVPIVDDTIRSVQDLAEKHGGSAKPSGAGGGDVALALFDGDGAHRDFVSSCGECGLIVLSLALGAYGLACERRGAL